jgi:hypothetical protein
MIRQIAKIHSVLLIPCLAVALAGSFWAIANENGCNICSESGALVGNLNLGAIGVATYGLLLVLALFLTLSPSRKAASPASMTLAAGMLIAGGVHVTLLALLIRHRVFCLPCFLTAAAALMGTLVVLAANRRRLPPAALLITAAAVLSYAGIKIVQRRAPEEYVRAAARAERMLVQQNKTPSLGHARMVVYLKPTCPWCKRFKAEVMPPLEREFRPVLSVEEQKAWNSMATPTIIILGRKNTRLIGYKPLDTVRKAVRLACGVDPPLARSP